MTKLTAKDQSLQLGEQILLIRYPEGDYDRIPWPLTPKFRPRLASVLYDAYEVGDTDDREFTLPDGTTFNVDSELAN